MTTQSQSSLTDGDLTDTAVEGSWGDIVTAAAGLTVYKRRRHHTLATEQYQVHFVILSILQGNKGADL